MRAAAIRLVTVRLDEFVSPSITRGGERRFQALLLRILLVFALGAALSFPVLLASGTSVATTALPLILAAVALASAAWLSIAGRPDAVLWLWGAMLCLGLTIAAEGAAGLAAVLPVVLVLLPLEAAVAGRPALASALFAVSLGCTLFAGVTAPAALGGPAAAALLAGLALVYGLRLARRARRSSRAARPGSEASWRDGREMRRRIAEEFATLMFEVSPGGRIDHASTAAAEAIAGPGWGFAGNLFGELCHVADRLAVMQAIDDARKGARPAFCEARLKIADGGFARFDLTICGAGEAGMARPGETCVRVVARPVAERPAAPAMDPADVEALREASAAKSRFLATVSHELRTPLNAIIGFSDVLDQEYFGGFESIKQKEYVGLIRQSGQHLLAIVNTLLDVSKIEAGRYEIDPEPFDLSELMAEIGDLMREEARRKGLRIDVRPSAGIDLVADRRACRQILLNLVANAVKFTEAGAVTLEARLRGGFCDLLVCDTGIGIAEADIHRLGIPFVQLSSGLSRRYQGTGLGLSLVKGLAELHGGGMTVQSQPGVGTMVTVRLPLAGPAAAADPSLTVPENIVALSDARSKTNPQPQTREKRRSA
ncbi:sensor histidine kinase [Jiella sonneratiae]|uniref:histidine kinase n=1 Tax=Jiella sonneratiae TaxID=2816856 RepID=A0ABS3JBK1_9HYPH|nr:HAMP domain-containing sensor histidine kinase [Jiella sonneratiae]MBO0905966.1 HAMP domain-containing histidine kinase [Jiella sonneratiae]